MTIAVSCGRDHATFQPALDGNKLSIENSELVTGSLWISLGRRIGGSGYPSFHTSIYNLTIHRSS
jgi:hypothetical protein